MNFRLNDVFKQNQLVQIHTEVVARDHHAGLALDHKRSFAELFIAEVELIVALRPIKIVENAPLTLLNDDLAQDCLGEDLAYVFRRYLLSYRRAWFLLG